MRRLTMLAALALPPVLHAQPAEAGVRAGRAWSSLVWDVPGPDDSYPNRGRRGVSVGAFARWPLRWRLSVQPELAVVQKGFERTQPTLHPTYLEAPLLLRVDTPGGPLGAFVIGGLAPAYELRCRMRVGPTVTDCDVRREPPLRNTTRAFDLGAVVGAGLTLGAGPGRLVLDARYTRGLVDVQPNVDLARTLNHSAALTAGYAVRVRR